MGLALLPVFVLGRTVSGARRWIHVGPFTFQPSELFKLIFIITLAWALTSARGERLSRVALVGTFVLLGIRLSRNGIVVRVGARARDAGSLSRTRSPAHFQLTAIGHLARVRNCRPLINYRAENCHKFYHRAGFAFRSHARIGTN